MGPRLPEVRKQHLALPPSLCPSGFFQVLSSLSTRGGAQAWGTMEELPCVSLKGGIYLIAKEHILAADNKWRVMLP